MGGKRICTDEEIKSILSCQGTSKDIASKCNLRWPERDISDVNIRSVRSTYLVDDHGNVTSRSVRTRLMLEQLSQNPELLAAKVKATCEAEQKEAAVQRAEQTDFELFQSSAKVRSALAKGKWQSDAVPPMAASSKIVNQARKQELIEPLNSTDTSSPIQSKKDSNHDFPAHEISNSKSRQTKTMSAPSFTGMGSIWPITFVTGENPLNDTPNSPISQQILAPVQTSIPIHTSFYDYVGSEIIEFRVGPKRKMFSIHKNLLAAKSKYIRLDPVVFLPTGDPDAFVLVFEWLYHEKISAFPVLGSRSNQETAESFSIRHTKAISTLMKVYSMALLWEMEELSDLVMNHIGKDYFSTPRWPSLEEFTAAYHLTRPGCGLRLFMARTFNYILLTCEDNNTPGEVSSTKELIRIADMLPSLKEESFKNLRGIVVSGSSKFLDPVSDMVCDYHEHGKQKACQYQGKDFTDVVI